MCSSGKVDKPLSRETKRVSRSHSRSTSPQTKQVNRFRPRRAVGSQGPVALRRSLSVQAARPLLDAAARSGIRYINQVEATRAVGSESLDAACCMVARAVISERDKGSRLRNDAHATKRA